MIRVFIADDHAIVRKGLIRLINDTHDMEVVGECGDGRSVLQRARGEAWDVLILDISLPDISGLDVLTRLREMHPPLKVLVLSMYPEDQYAVRALRLGAAGYLPKSSAPEQLIDAVRKIHGGGRFITPTAAELLLVEINRGEKTHEQLSNRELEVLVQIARGQQVAQIARRLKLSVSTVNTYRNRIREKLDLRTNAEIIRYALQNGLID